MEGGWRPCRLVPFEGGGAGKLVGPSLGQCTTAAWSPDGKWMYFSVNTGNGYHTWRQGFPDGVPEQVTFGATEEEGIAFAPDGRSFATSVGTRQTTLWVHDSRGERQITSEGYEIEVARTVSGAPIRAAVDTHFHLDHSFGNLGYAEQKIAIIAHEKVTPLMRERYAALKGADKSPFLAPVEQKLANAKEPIWKQRQKPICR